MSSYLVQEEDGVSRFTLEDGSGFILLEAQGPAPAPTTGGGGIISVRRRRRIDIRRITQDDDEALALTLLLRTIRRRSTK